MYPCKDFFQWDTSLCKEENKHKWRSIMIHLLYLQQTADDTVFLQAVQEGFMRGNARKGTEQSRWLSGDVTQRWEKSDPSLHWSGVSREEEASTIKDSSTINWLLRLVTMAMFGIVVAVAIFLETVSATSVCIIYLKCFLPYLLCRISYWTLESHSFYYLCICLMVAFFILYCIIALMDETTDRARPVQVFCTNICVIFPARGCVHRGWHGGGRQHPPWFPPTHGHIQRNSLCRHAWKVWETKASPWLGWCVNQTAI